MAREKFARGWVLDVPTECPDCTYPRTGLARGASCPECRLALLEGAPVMLHRFKSPGHDGFSRMSGFVLNHNGLWLLLLAGCVALVLLKADSRNPWWTLFWIAGCFAHAGLSIRRMNSSRVRSGSIWYFSDRGLHFKDFNLDTSSDLFLYENVESADRSPYDGVIRLQPRAGAKRGLITFPTNKIADRFVEVINIVLTRLRESETSAPAVEREE